MADQVELGDDLEASLLSHASSESQRDTIARQLALLRSQQAALASCTDLQARLVAKVEEARMASTSSAHASAHAAAAVEEQQDRASTDPPIGSGPPSGKPGPEHAAGSGVANAPARPGAAHEADVVPQREQERPEQGQQLLPPPPPLPSPFPEGASAEEVCSSVYSLLDNPGASEERGLAALSASSTGAVKQRFRQMREAMRGLLSRVGRRKRSGAWAGAPDGGEDDAVVAGGDRGGTGGDAGAGPSTSAAPAPAGASLGSVEEHRRQQQLVKLRDLLTGDGGGLRATGGGGAGPRGAGARSAPGGDPGGLLVVQMAVTSSYEVRSAQLSALLATKSVQLYRLVSPRLLETLGAWLQEAEADGQVTFLELLLRTAAHLPLPLTMLLTSPLQKDVLRLVTKARAPRVAAAAAAAVARWRALAAGQTVTTQVGRTGNSGRLGLAEDLAEALAGKDSNGGGRRSGSKDADGGTAGAAAAAASVAAAAAAKQVFKQPKAAHYSTKAISADDIRKAREKAKARAAYAGQVKSSGPGSSGGAPASPLHDATDPSAAAAAASVAAGEAPPAKRQALAPPPPRVTPMPSAFAADAGSAAPAAAGQSTSQQAHQQARGGSGGGAWQHGAPAAAGAAGGGRGQGAGAGAGGGVGGVRDLDDCPPEVLERLRRKREARHRAQLAAAKVSSRPAVQAEVVKAVVAREERAEVAAVRRAARVLKELEAAEAARDYVDAMAPTLAWPGRPLGVPVPYAGVESAPPRLPWHLLAGVCAGEESTEIGARQADADAAGLPHWVRAPPMSRTPDDAAAEAVGCREHVPHGAPEPVIPWVPADVGEMMGMNERVWDAGIRLPGYVEDPVLLQQRHGYLRPPGGSLPSASSLPSGGLLPGHGGAGQPQLTVSSPAEAVSLLARLLATPGQLQAMVAAQPQLFDPFADALAQSADPQAAALLAQLHASGVGGPHREHQRGDNGMHGGGGGHYHGPVEGAQPVALVLPTTQRYDPMYDSQQAPGQQQQRQYDPAYDTQQAPGQQQQQQPYDSQRRQQAGGRPYDAQNQQQQFPPMYDSQHPPAAGGQQQQYNDPMDTDGYYPRDPPHHHRQQQPHPHHNGARRGDYSDRAPQHHHGAGRDPGLDDGGHAAAMRAVGYRDAAPHSSSSHAGAPAVGGSSRKQYAAPASRVEERTHRYDNSQQYDQGGGGDRGGYRGGGYDRGGAAAAGEQGARQQQQQPRQRDGDPQYRYGAQYGAEGDPAPPHGDRGWQQQQQHGGGGASPHQDSEPYGRRGGEQGGGHGSRPSARR